MHTVAKISSSTKFRQKIEYSWGLDFFGECWSNLASQVSLAGLTILATFH